MSTPDPGTTKWVPLWDTGASVGGGGGGVGAIPGEIKMWPNTVVPLLADYGLWVWADGGAYLTASYPKASANIAAAWKTAHGQADPGAGSFRVPDLRGLAPVGLDAMPGGTRANRVTRAVAITIAAKTGEETHVITLPEVAVHSHTVNSHSHGGGYHDHGGGYHGHYYTTWSGSPQQVHTFVFGDSATNAYGSQSAALAPNYSGLTAQSVVGAEAPGTNNQGSGTAHETMQPSVFVPWIVKLDD